MFFFLECFQTDTFLVSLCFVFLFRRFFKLVFFPEILKKVLFLIFLFGFVLKEYPPYFLNLPKGSKTNLICLLKKELLFLSDVLFQIVTAVAKRKMEGGDALSSFTASRY